MTMSRTVVDRGNIELEGAEVRDELLTFAGADDFAPGTILARDSSSQKLVLFVKGGSTNQNGIPKAVLGYRVTAAGPGDKKVRAIVFGKVNKNRLIIDADGNGTNIDGAVLDQLRDYGITPVDVQQLGALDN